MGLVRLLVAISIMSVFGCAFEVDEAMERDAETQEMPPGSWVPRDARKQLDSDEQLAIQVVSAGGQKQENHGRVATMFQESPPTSIVLVESLPSGNEPLTKLVLYHLEGESIVSVTTPQFVDKKKEEDQEKRRQAAQEVAYQAKNRTLPLIPVLWWGKYTYSPDIVGGCEVTVVERDTAREETGSFTIDVCAKEKKQ
jgi:hypothetical protein